MNQSEARALVSRKDRLRFDIADDVSVGLMFPFCDVLPGFTHIAREEQELSDLIAGILNTKAVHVRLQHFSLEKARALWGELGEHEIWR